MLTKIEIKKVPTNNNNMIESHKIEIKCPDGKRVKGYIDKKKGGKDNAPVVVISHGYGETKRDYISTSYYLASNGFTVLRYDCLNHLGESDGDMINFTLKDMETSLLNAIGYVRKNFKAANHGIIASSLSSRVAFKVVAKEKAVKYLIALTSVVNLQDTLFSLYKEDLMGEYKSGTRWGALDILGFEVKDDFLHEAIENKYEDLNSTIADLKHIDIPICYLVAGDDAWIKYKDMKTIYANTLNRDSKFITITNALHQIQENPRLAQMAILKMAGYCREYALGNNLSNAKLQKPSIRNIVVQNKIETADLKSTFFVTKTDEQNFWVSYLSKFFMIMKSRDYQNLLSLIAQLLGEIEDGCCMLDAGCGNGHFGAWLLLNINTTIQKNAAKVHFKYTGLDFAEDALLDARKVHADILSKISSTYAKKIKCDFEYIMQDIEEGTIFEDDMFDKICCNLVVSYLKDPERALKDLYSKLKPGGRIVVSSLKPYNDLSLIYKNYLDQNVTPEDILVGRSLLSSAGKIRHREKQGHYHFFSEEELEKMMARAGFIRVKMYRAFGNQANVAVAEK
jgi:ubiquinone/menaquinone biosynthesis C-methylase UbiE/pimeloyl-ACP methyl ester carboxylesterase